ncbi:MAG TPA: hypothetical protein DDZ51_07260 [Planctomycetaceae bacterium]|nr:hypothetical protein [Planctomycetaceae bacterium]
MMQKNVPLYRIGLFGRSNAGKTSLLVALSETVQATVDGQTWTIQYLPPVEGSIKDKGLLDKLSRGERLLQQAKASIKESLNPRPSMEAENTTLYRFQLACGGSVRTVELCDYAGEILTPERLTNVESHGHELAKRIANCDAVFVLAPASDNSDESKVDAERSNQVAKSLARLFSWIKDNDPLHKTHKRPFGLLVTKVDRAAPSANRSVEDFGDPAKLVWDQVQSLVGPAFTKWFGLTMLPGHDSLGRKVEPDGLIGPLIWAMDTADNEIVDISRSVDEQGGLAWLQSPLHVRSVKQFGLSQVSALLDRRPAMSDQTDLIHQEARRIRRSLRRSLRRQLLTVVAGILVVLLLGVSAFDAVRTSSYQRIAEDSESSTTDLSAAADYFAGYGDRTLRMSPFGFDHEKATTLRDLARSHIAEKQWIEVERESDPVEKGKLAGAYRGQEHRDEASRLIAAGKQELDRRTYAAWFDPIESISKQISLSMDQRAKIIDSLSTLPTELIETSTQRQHRIEIQNRLQKEQADEQTKLDRDVFVQQVESLAQRQRPFEALGAISVRVDCLEWDEMKPTLALLATNWARDIDNQLSRFKKDEQFDSAIQTLQKAIRDRKLLPASSDIPVEPKLDELLAGIEAAWDKTDYGNFKRRPSLAAADEYLGAAHPKCMYKTVERWKTWKENEGSSRSLVPHLESITWDKAKGATDPIVDFYVNGKQFLSKQYAGKGGYGETYKFPDSTASTQLSPDDTVEVRIVLWNDNFDLIGDSLVGEFKDTFRFSDLTSVKGASGTLPTDDKKATHVFRVRLLGMPAAPELIEWQPCR